MKNPSKLNIAHSTFPEAIRGIMVCGYEWGEPKKDQIKYAIKAPVIDFDSHGGYFLRVRNSVVSSINMIQTFAAPSAL